MRTPLSTPIRFPIASPRDLLSKARRELDRLTDSVEGAWAESNPIVIADQTINAAWSLWHVTDWIGNNDDPDVARVVPERIKSTERERTQAFQRQLRSESEDLEICWNLALRFKHFELERASKARGVLDTDQVYVSASSAHISDPPDEPVDYSVGGSATISGLSLWTLHPKVTHDGERKRLVDVYGRAYQFLDRLLKKHGL